MKSARVCLAVVGLLGLAGCGGGGGNGGPGPEVTQSPYRVHADRLLAGIDRAQGLADTPVGEMPTSGSARYRGTGGLVLDKGGAFEDRYIGDLSLAAYFGQSRISGQLRNFDAESGADIRGALTIDKAPIVGNGFNTTLRGNLTSNGTPVRIAADVQGGFGGPSAQGVFGLYEGTGTRGGVALPVTDGIFVGYR